METIIDESPEGLRTSEKSEFEDHSKTDAVPPLFAVRVTSSSHKETESSPEIVISGNTVTVANVVSEAGHRESNMYKLTV